MINSINPSTFLGARLLAMVLLFLDSGIRAGELASLKLADVDWKRGVFKIMGKGSKERFVPIGSTAKQTLLRYAQTFRPTPARDDIDNVFLSVDGYPLTVNAIVHTMSRLAKSSGVTRLHAHLLRHILSPVAEFHIRGNPSYRKCRGPLDERKSIETAISPEFETPEERTSPGVY